MTKYINADELMKSLTTETGCMDRILHAADVADIVKNVPAADVRENVRGEWLHRTYCFNGDIGGLSMYQCSKCDFIVLTDEYNFCPNCGADMRGEE